MGMPDDGIGLLKNKQTLMLCNIILLMVSAPEASMMSTTKKRIRDGDDDLSGSEDESDDNDEDDDDDDESPKAKKMKTHNKRERKKIEGIFKEQGPYYTRRAMRMQSVSFWRLVDIYILVPHLEGNKGNSPKRHRNGAKNGLISPEIRVSAAIHYFAGGRPDDISLVYGISHTQRFTIVSGK